MLGAYGWAYVKPVRKLFYNMTITFVSIAVALLVGAVEALGIVANQLTLQGGLWDRLADLNGNFGALRFAVIGLLLVSWSASMLIYKVRRYDEMDVAMATRPLLKEGAMFARFSKWLDGLKARRDTAQAVLMHASDVARAHDHGHSHEHFDGVVREQEHGHGDHDHRHLHDVGGSRPDA